MPLPDPPLLVISDRKQATRPLPEIAAASFAAGCRWLSLREKDLPPDDQRTLLAALKEVAAPFGATVMLHGDPALAREAGTGVHLGAGADVAAARAQLGPQALIGLSVHDAEEARAAIGADYVIAAPVFLTASKPGYGPALGAAGLAAIVAASPVPVIALGGIENADRATACRASGAAGIAVMGAVMRATAVAAAVTPLLAALARRDQARPG